MSRTYIQAEVAAFLRTSDTFGAFSNMHSGFALRVVDHHVPATENYYQAMRFPHLPGFQAEILAQPHPVKAKRLAYTRSKETRADWYDVNIPLMRHSLRLRYGHHPDEMAELFAKTKDIPIVEISNRDNFWGTFNKNGILRGENILGRLWMELRQEVADHDPTAPFEVAAPKIPDLVLCGREVATFTPEPVRKAQASFDI